MIVEDQTEVEAFLQAWRPPGSAPAQAQIITTHISKIFLAGDRALKLKRAVRYPYVDFSDAARRHAACVSEVRLNRRTAPTLYLGARTITRERDGRLAFDGAGPMVDAVVEMARFDQARLADAMAQNGELTIAMIERLARRIAEFHAGAPVSRERAGGAAMRAVLDINAASLRQSGFLAPQALGALLARFDAAHARLASALDARAERGKVRRCHGDLTLRNICVIDGEPTPFDCLEFNDGLATVDVLYDLAFLIMDLAHRGLKAHANVLFNRYFDEADEDDGLALVSFFAAVRAEVRGHVAAARAVETAGEASAQAGAEARSYLDLAGAMLDAPHPRLIAVGGLSGSGKSTVAAQIAPHLGPAPGARILSSDRIRKRLHGVRPDQPLPQAAYAPEVSARVYGQQRNQAADALRAGVCVVADAVFDRPGRRDAIAAAAREAGRPFDGFWLEAPIDALSARIEARKGDPSDATVAVLRAQAAKDCGPIAWRRLDATRPVADIVADALSLTPK